MPSINWENQLKQLFGFSDFKGNQKSIIESISKGQDAFVIMPTGGGKSLCYQLPALVSQGTAIVVSPLIALMKNQVDAIRGYSEKDGIAHVLNSSLTKGQLEQVHIDLKSGLTKLLFVAPESLNKKANIELLGSIPISFFAIDEAHCISEWGHDFRPDYRTIKESINALGRKPIIALTATATPKVQADIMKTLGMEEPQVFLSSFNRSNLYYEVRPKRDIDRDITKLLQANKGRSAIVYCLSRQKVEDLAEQLQVNGINALPYHAGLEGSKRIKHQDAFLNEDCDVIVATIAFGMGIDKPDVRFVLHYDMPKSLESYYQETGRAGRDGGEGSCITYFDIKDIERLQKFLNKKNVSEQEIGRQLLEEATGYAEAATCRRRALLHYFGEEFHEDNCEKMCDNCRHPKEKVDASTELLDVIAAVNQTHGKFKTSEVINILRGHSSAVLVKNDATNLSSWGIQKDKSEAHLRAVIRQGIIRHYLSKNIDAYGTIQVTEKGNAGKLPKAFRVRKELDYDELNSERSAPTKVVAVDKQLFSILKDLRKKIGNAKDVPPYAVFSENSLSEMATVYPCTLDELKNIQGVGEGKAKKFGIKIVEAIQRYVEENDIDRPQDMVFKTIANKSVLKVYIIQSTDRKLPFDDIAKAKGLKMDQLLEEMERIVISGTKLNIDYYLKDILDDESIEEIFEFLTEDSQEGSLDELTEEFSEEYEEEELRLARLKFFSDVAN
jgi:ATP-dependent DNA helicase RecQ|tara:strand:- start:5062 stop:7236 length:2175 start_codon:yes stop_codon:yes gene_type:complete